MRYPFCSLFILLLILIFSSCNNGAYDAQPETDNSNTEVGNNQVGSLQLGQMQATIDDVQYIFGLDGNWTVISDTSIVLSASRKLSAGPTHAHGLSIHINPYAGPGSYTNNVNYPQIYMLSLHADNGNTYLSYGSILTPSHFTVQVESVEGINIKGKFSGVIYKVSGAGADSTVITNGSFYLPQL